MPAMDALHTKNLLIDDLEHGGLRSYLRSFVESVEGRHTFPEKDGLPTPLAFPGTYAQGVDGDALADTLANILRGGEAYYIDSHMLPLITAAAESMPEEDVRLSDLPSEYGFMLIPGGISKIDIRFMQLKLNALIWNRRGNGVDLHWLTDKYDMTDSQNVVMAEKYAKRYASIPRFTVVQSTRIEFDAPLPLSTGPDFVLPPEVANQIRIHYTDSGDLSMWVPEGYSAPELQERINAAGIRTDSVSRWLLTTWRLMQQSITSVVTEEPPRQLRRQLERKNLPSQHVTVITLRRSSIKGDGTTEVEWTHRWLVRGHWRNQPCKDENGEWIHRLIYIHPYVKGPEDAPLLIREHVYSLAR